MRLRAFYMNASTSSYQRTFSHCRRPTGRDVLGLDSPWVLIGALEQRRESRGDVHPVVTEARVARVLEITGLAETFPVHSSHDELRNAVGEESRR